MWYKTSADKEKKKDEIRKILFNLFSEKPNKHFGILNNNDIKYEDAQIKNALWCSTNSNVFWCCTNNAWWCMAHQL